MPMTPETDSGGTRRSPAPAEAISARPTAAARGTGFRFLSVGLLLAGTALASAADPPSSTTEPDRTPDRLPDRIPETIAVDHDDIVVTRDCVLVAGDLPVADANGDGVVRIVGDGITVLIDGAIRGTASGLDPDRRRGIGIVIVGDDVTLRGGGVHGFRVGVEVRGADRVVIEDLDASHQFAQRLRSTPEREDPSDWLRPHENDAGEWATHYGASIRVTDADAPVLRRVRVRGSQNGLMLERVRNALVVDCDSSFLSGWGLAMWRTEQSTIARNAFDFCVRGYSHGVYNRGQDSAGILVFEQCSSNRFLENSCTHGGDGVFGFGGRQALGQAPPPPGADDDWHHGRGNTGNLFLGNDLSHAVAHGFEMTFSRGWLLDRNRLHDNGICGVWGGYSSQATLHRNDFADNGAMAYGREGGGINIEHGVGNLIRGNRFVRNTEGIELWWDDDAALLQTPWGVSNDTRSADTVVTDNVFIDCGTAIDLRRTENTRIIRNSIEGDGVGIALEASPGTSIRWNRLDAALPIKGGDLLDNGGAIPPMTEQRLEVEIPGESTPVGGRRHLAGRDRIVMTEWGPYDWTTPLLRLESSGPERQTWRLLGPLPIAEFSIDGCPAATAARGEELDRVVVSLPPIEGGAGLVPYRLRVVPQGGAAIEADGRFMKSTWRIDTFPTSGDPREDPGRWTADRTHPSLTWTVDRLDLVYAMGGPADVAPAEATTTEGRPAPGRDRFGTVASTTFRLPAGRYRLQLVSDDGIRVRLDGRDLLEDWTWHPPTEDTVDFELDETRDVSLEIEHFELDGYALLRAELVPLD